MSRAAIQISDEMATTGLKGYELEVLPSFWVLSRVLPGRQDSQRSRWGRLPPSAPRVLRVLNWRVDFDILQTLVLRAKPASALLFLLVAVS
jgi:hypothetical protein